MKPHALPLVGRPDLLPCWTPLLVAEQRTTPITAASARAPRRAVNHLPRALRVVGLLAFGQSLLFLVFWLFVCARAGAGETNTTAAASAAAELRPSEYKPTKVRDPFLAPGVTLEGPLRVATVDPAHLRLEGILYHPSKPSAMVNGQLLTPNKPVLLKTPVGEVEVKALRITREMVTVQVGEQTIELRIERPQPLAPDAASAPAAAVGEPAATKVQP